MKRDIDEKFAGAALFRPASRNSITEYLELD